MQRQGWKKNGMARLKVPARHTVGENIFFKLITCFMYLGGCISHGYLSSCGGSPWSERGTEADLNEQKTFFLC